MRKYCIECGNPLDAAFRGTTDYARAQMRYCSDKCKQHYKNRHYYAAHRDEIRARVTANKRKNRLAQDRATGFVYVIRCAELYKIGATRNATQRIARFETAYPHELRVIRVSRVKGEWFELDSNDLRVIARLLPSKIEVKQ